MSRRRQSHRGAAASRRFGGHPAAATREHRKAAGSCSSSCGLLVCLAVGIVGLGRDALRRRVRQEGISTLFRTGFFTDERLVGRARLGDLPGPDRDAVSDGGVHPVHRPDRRRHRRLPRGVRGPGPAGTTASSSSTSRTWPAVPSIIYGILGLAFLVRGPLSLGRVVLAGGLTLGLLVLPVVIIAGREALRAVPPSIREGSMALGATQWQTIWKQVLPAAIPGHRDGHDPRALARDRRDGAPDPDRRRGVRHRPGDRLLANFTALPLQIFSWISNAQQEQFAPLAAAAIIVLMVVLLAMNAVRDLATKRVRAEVVTGDQLRRWSRVLDKWPTG